MKILAGNLNGKNINFYCKCCNASFDLESKEDFSIRWVYKPINRERYDRHTQIPDYSVKCPVCGYETPIGLDPLDCGKDFNEVLIRSVYADIIFNRKDWKKRYKTDIRICNK